MEPSLNPLPRQVADVESLDNDHGRTLLNNGSELAVSDVDGEDFGCAPLEQHLTEPARGCTGIKCNSARRVDTEGVERSNQFVSRATDVVIRARDDDLRGV